MEDEDDDEDDDDEEDDDEDDVDGENGASTSDDHCSLSSGDENDFGQRRKTLRSRKPKVRLTYFSHIVLERLVYARFRKNYLYNRNTNVCFCLNEMIYCLILYYHSISLLPWCYLFLLNVMVSAQF